MNPLLEQFLSEARDFLQSISESLMKLEQTPDDAGCMDELFRFVHTLKGNSGLFSFPEMTRVLHAAEDLMDAVRGRRVAYSPQLADRLLDAMDFVGMLCDQIERDGTTSSACAGDALRLSEALREWIGAPPASAVSTPEPIAAASAPSDARAAPPLPEAIAMRAWRKAQAGEALWWLVYRPEEDCFFSGGDPLFQAMNTPDTLWGEIAAREVWPALAEMDAYRCMLDFHLLSSAPRDELDEYYRYMPERVHIEAVESRTLIQPQGAANDDPLSRDFAERAQAMLQRGELDALLLAARALLELSNPDLWLSSVLRWLILLLETAPDTPTLLTPLIASLNRMTPIDWRMAAGVSAGEISSQPPLSPGQSVSEEDAGALAELVATQRAILQLPVETDWHLGRLQAVGNALAGCLQASGQHDALPALQQACAQAQAQGAAAPLLAWLDQHFAVESAAVPPPAGPADSDTEVRFGRRAEDAPGAPRSLKVDQAKVDRLMNLIGEIVVAKNALPYLAGRAETVYGVRDLAREIKSQYAVINRIAEEMQDAIMQVRMMPVSFVFQRFPRLVRDLSHKLDKEVNLQMEGEDTEADKNIIESLGDPLVHLVRNSLDHGFETPQQRRAAGKSAAGTLTLRAMRESDRVVIEVEDDGCGIDADRIRAKALQKGLIDQATLERLSDQEAINLVFRPGFSTMDVVSDLSGRGVGMDVVRSAVEKVGGSIVLDSQKGRGTRLRMSLPLSMAVSTVMIVEAGGQWFGMPMETVVETVRVSQRAIRTIKHSQATVLRGRIVPLKSLHQMLGLSAAPRVNEQDELAILVVRLGDEVLGLIVDDFRETVDIILKPLSGVLAGLSAYAGSALMGDGSVLMVLNVKELI